MRLYLLLFIIIALFSGYFMYNYQLRMSGESASESVSIGGDFSLFNQYGNVVTNRNMLDHYSIVMFGFSRCSSICPNQLTMLSTVLETIGNKVSVYFITLDPENDTIETLKKFHNNFHSSITMLTGNKTAIDNLVKDYKVYSSLDEDPEKTSHSSILYLMDKSGKYTAHFTTMDPEEFIRELKMKIS